MDSKTIKLFTIPFSGGNAYSYSEFRKYLPGNIELYNLELPGRGKRIKEPLLYTIESMSEDLLLQMEGQLHTPFAIFGHSLGALLGFSLCRLMALRGLTLPGILFLSGQVPASMTGTRYMTDMSDESFIHMIREMGGTPNELLSDRQFLQFYLPIIRADFRAVSEYIYLPSSQLPNIPFVILLGLKEDIEEQAAVAWQTETSGKTTIHWFEGGHFFIFHQTEPVCRLIADQCLCLPGL